MMTIDLKTGLLNPVRYIPSPHCDARPEGMAIDMIVIHGISLPRGEFGNQAVEALFQGCLDEHAHPAFKAVANLQVSAHLFITRQGEIIQFVPFNQRAWHAGVSFFQGRERCNDFSIGIELEGADDIPYEPIQYQQLSRVIMTIRASFPQISNDRIVGHMHIAPGRKTDPGPVFDWTLIKEIA